MNNVIASDKLMAGSEKLGVDEKIKRLKGQRVAMPSANGSARRCSRVLAKKYGLTLPGDISSVYLGAEAPSYVAAFQKDLMMPRYLLSQPACWCSSQARARSTST